MYFFMAILRERIEICAYSLSTIAKRIRWVESSAICWNVYWADRFFLYFFISFNFFHYVSVSLSFSFFCFLSFNIMHSTMTGRVNDSSPSSQHLSWSQSLCSTGPDWLVYWAFRFLSISVYLLYVVCVVWWQCEHCVTNYNTLIRKSI